MWRCWKWIQNIHRHAHTERWLYHKHDFHCSNTPFPEASVCVCIDFHLIYINVRLSSVTICAITVFAWFPRERGMPGCDAMQFNMQPHAGPTDGWEREAQHRWATWKHGVKCTKPQINNPFTADLLVYYYHCFYYYCLYLFLFFFIQFLW